jgi:hypothetical protein
MTLGPPPRRTAASAAAAAAPPRLLRALLAGAAALVLLSGPPSAPAPAPLLLLSPLSARGAQPLLAHKPPPPPPRPYEDPAGFPALRVAMQSVWDAPPAAILDELWPLRVAAERALRRRLVPADGAEPDLYIIGPYGGRRDDVEALAMRTRGRAVTLFLGSENSDGGGGRYDELRDHLVGITTLSIGFRRDVEAAAREREAAMRAAAAAGAASAADPLALPRPYLRLPGWLANVCERSNASGIALPAALLRSRAPGPVPGAREEAEAWARREGFAAILSSHYAYPRGEMFDALSALGRVDGPGLAFHTLDWPADLPNTGHLGGGKVAFLRRYRFNACPENSRSGDGGYTTEKMPQAHLAGAVPLYWGDAPAEVWSERRVVRFEPERAGGVAEALETVAQLEGNASFRAEWFARPLLAEGAEEWVAQWLADAEALLRDAFGALDAAKRMAEEDRRNAGLAAAGA